MSRQAWQGRGFTTSRLHEETGLHQSGLNLLAGLRNAFNSGDQPAIEEPFKLHRKVGMWHMSHFLTITVEGANKCRRIVTGNIWKSYMCTADRWRNEIQAILAAMNTSELVVEMRLEKNSGANGIWTHDFCDTGAALYQLSYWIEKKEFLLY